MYKKTCILLFLAFLAVSCQSPTKELLNASLYEDVKDEILKSDMIAPKKRYVVDMLWRDMTHLQIGTLLNLNKESLPTFQQRIDIHKLEYDSILAQKLRAVDRNKKIQSFIVVDSAFAELFNKHSAQLQLNVRFDNQFGKDVSYILVKYGFTDKHNIQRFSSRANLTSDFANGFKGSANIATFEEYNEVATYLVNNCPTNKVEQKDFFAQGLFVEIEAIYFKDKTEVRVQDTEWSYLK